MNHLIERIPQLIPLSDRELEEARAQENDPGHAELMSLVQQTYGIQEQTQPDETQFISNDQVIKALNYIAEKYRSGVCYETLRREFIGASFAANEFGLMAPVFRPQPKMSGKKAEWTKQGQLLRDLVVIDCHWLYCRKERVDAKWPEIERALDCSNPFDGNEVMERMARKKWSSGFRVSEVLILTHRQQFELVQLRDDEVKAKMRLLLEGGTKSLGKDIFGKERKEHIRSPFAEVRRKIREWAEVRPSVKASVSMYESLWLARELLGEKATLKQIAELAALRCGCKPLSPKTIDDKLKALDRRLAVATA